jgi:hypothetical protein
MRLRNDAAHGWFDKIDRDVARRVLEQVSSPIPTLRAIEARLREVNRLTMNRVD